MADVDVDLLLEAGDLGPELAVEGREGLEVEGDAGRLHPGQDRDQRQLDLAEQAVEAVLLERPREGLADGERGQRLEAARSARGEAGAAGGRIWSRCSATTSAIVWLRSAALRM